VRGTTPVLADPSDVFELTLDLDAPNDVRELEPGESATIRTVTRSDGTTGVAIDVPDSLR
jgi:uncharacterized cupredoxin-like copper-binding protein